jgi:hypothetical protein
MRGSIIILVSVLGWLFVACAPHAPAPVAFQVPTRRAEDRLWDTYDWFQKQFFEDDPVNGGLFDLNRYYYAK